MASGSRSAGTGGSWFRYAGKRIEAGSRMPGWVERSEIDWYGTIADREDS